MKQKLNKDLTIIKEAEAVTREVPVLAIVDTATLTRATDTLSLLNTYLDKVTAEKERVTRPLNEALRAERSRWKPIETQLEGAIDSIRLKMTEYQTKLINTQKDAQERVAGLVASGEVSLSAGLKKLSKVEVPVDTVTAENGSVSFRAKDTLEIVSRESIPDKYWIVDEALVFDDLKNGHVISGACIKVIQVPVNNRSRQ